MTTVTFDFETDFNISNFEGLTDINEENVSFARALDLDDDRKVVAARVNVRQLIHTLKLHTANERTRFGWR